MLPSIQPGDDKITSLEVAEKGSGYKQNNQIEIPKLTLSEQRKKDALDMAELIYNIYNINCPIPSLVEKQKGENNV